MELSPEAHWFAAIVVAVMVLWVTEALPLPVTALLGAAACVMAGVAPAREVFRPFAEPVVFLFIGSFMLAEAIRVHGLDRRLAYGVLGLPWVGERPARIVVAVAAVTAALSAFISNTATTAMMAAIASGILAAVEDAGRRAGRRPSAGFATCLMLCVAYAASIGGLATPIGTPPNVIGLGFIRNELGIDVPFFTWTALGTPVAALLVAVAVLLLLWMFPAGVDRLDGVASLVASERGRLGGWTTGQRSTAVAFALTVALWMLPGAAALALGSSHPAATWLTARVPEGVAALVGAILLFVLPGGPGRRALTWSEAAAIDWGIVLLYGGGMALGELAFSTGLAAAIGTALTGWLPSGGGSTGALIAMTAAVAVLTSEFTSNTASATMVVPVAMALARAAGGDPFPAALAATLAASLGFMLPVSTPCNAIVYGSGRIPLRAMIASGAVLDLIGAAVIAVAVGMAGGR